MTSICPKRFGTVRNRFGFEVNCECKEKKMENNFMQSMGADKYMNRLFRKAEGVVWDLMTGRVGIRTPDGSIATLTGSGDDSQIEINLMDQFGMSIPAFAQSTPIDSVSIGDVIFFGNSEKPGWVIEKKYGVKPVGSSTTAAAKKAKAATEALIDPASIDHTNVQFTLMKVDGQRTTWKPPKVTLLGMGDTGVMVLRSLLTMLPGGNAGLQGMQGMLMPMMMMGGDTGMDLEKMLPIMLMGQMQAQPMQNPDGTTSVAPNPMANMLPMMMMMSMMKGGSGDSPFSMLGGNNKKNNGPFRG
jgi:hypothetical protein